MVAFKSSSGEKQMPRDLRFDDFVDADEGELADTLRSESVSVLDEDGLCMSVSQASASAEPEEEDEALEAPSKSLRSSRPGEADPLGHWLR